MQNKTILTYIRIYLAYHMFIKIILEYAKNWCE